MLESAGAELWLVMEGESMPEDDEVEPELAPVPAPESADVCPAVEPPMPEFADVCPAVEPGRDASAELEG